MSDVMLFGVLKMPYEMAMASELSRMQFYQRVQQLVALVEAQQKQPKPQPLTPAQRVNIADACAELDFDDDHLGSVGKIVDLVEAAHGIGTTL